MGISHQAVYIGFGLTLALGFAAGLFIFFRFVTYEPRALMRVPEDASYVARLNVQQAVVQRPLRQFVMPLLEQGREPPESRLKHIERKTTLELDVDVREMVLAELGPERWLIVLGGFLRSDEVVEGLGRVLSDEGIEFEVKDGHLVRPSGVSLCVAEDGTLVIAARQQDAVEACGRPRAFPSWAAAISGAGAALSVRAKWPGDPATGTAPSPELLGATFVVDADSHFPTRATLELGEGKPSWDQLRGLLGEKSQNFNYLVPVDLLRPQPSDGGEFRARGNLSREQFDESVRRFADLIRAHLNEAGEMLPKSPNHAQ